MSGVAIYTGLSFANSNLGTLVPSATINEIVAPSGIFNSGSINAIMDGSDATCRYSTVSSRVSIDANSGAVTVNEDPAEGDSCDVTFLVTPVGNEAGAREVIVPCFKSLKMFDLSRRIGYLPYISNELQDNAKRPVTMYAEFIFERTGAGGVLISDRTGGKSHCITIARFGSQTVAADTLGGGLVCRCHKRWDTYSNATNDEVGNLTEHSIFSYSSNNVDGATLFDNAAGVNLTYFNAGSWSTNCIGLNYEFPIGYSNFPNILGLSKAALDETLGGNTSYVKSGASTVKLKRLIIHTEVYSTLEELLENVGTASVYLVGIPDGRFINLASTTQQPVVSEQLSVDAFTA